jgi:uncharacterized lipoprotein YddW (UPF0748 family)
MLHFGKRFLAFHIRFSVCIGMLSLATTSWAEPEPPHLPQPAREFRAAWVATVANIDWPSEPGLTSEQQQQEFTRIVERAVELNLNALIFQVRPAADALFDSAFEPWSPYLTGTMGKPPTPAYDPLAFAIKTAHEHGIELHVWFNPYRALHKSFQGKVSDDHISKVKPTAVKAYGGYLWLDPGDREAAQHSLDVMLDVVRRYDIDGVHMDDYFYPYPVKDDDGHEVPFPDDASFANAQADGYEGTRDDWRRSNVDWLVEKLHHYTKQMKPWVRVGISPFGIWRPGYPESIKGFDAYDKLYADAKKWLQEGWVDYLTPQLYWTIESKGQSYPKLLEWWSEQNTKQVHLWPGNYTSRVGMKEGTNWEADELLRQIEVTRQHPGATGNVHFSMKSLFDDYSDLGTKLQSGPYALPALVPLRNKNDSAPTNPSTDSKQPWLWVAWTKDGSGWNYEIVPGSTPKPDTDYVAKVDRDGNMSQPMTRN